MSDQKKPTPPEGHVLGAAPKRVVPSWDDDSRIHRDPYYAIDRIRRDSDEWRDEHIQAHMTISDRLTKAEGRDEAVERRLAEGVQTFTDIRTELRAMSPKPLSTWKVIGFILGPVLALLVLVGGFIWQAAKYPDRSEFEDAKKQIGEVQTRLTVDISAFKVEQVQLKSDVAATKDTVKKMDDKLDKLLERRQR